MKKFIVPIVLFVIAVVLVALWQRQIDFTAVQKQETIEVIK